MVIDINRKIKHSVTRLEKALIRLDVAYDEHLGLTEEFCIAQRELIQHAP